MAKRREIGGSLYLEGMVTIAAKNLNNFNDVAFFPPSCDWEGRNAMLNEGQVKKLYQRNPSQQSKLFFKSDILDNRGVGVKRSYG